MHYLPNAIDLQVYQALATIDGNEAVYGTTAHANGELAGDVMSR